MFGRSTNCGDAEARTQGEGNSVGVATRRNTPPTEMSRSLMKPNFSQGTRRSHRDDVLLNVVAEKEGSAEGH